MYGLSFIPSFQNEDISSIIYEQEWYTRSKKVQKLYLMFLLHLRNPIKVPFFGIRIMNLNFYLRVLRHMYSIINAMRLNLNNFS